MTNCLVVVDYRLSVETPVSPWPYARGHCFHRLCAHKAVVPHASANYPVFANPLTSDRQTDRRTATRLSVLTLLLALTESVLYSDRHATLVDVRVNVLRLVLRASQLSTSHKVSG